MVSSEISRPQTADKRIENTQESPKEREMRKKQVLLIGDMVSYGKIATSAMTPILSHEGFVTYNLPTALVSNNFEYKNYALLDTTDYIRQTLKVWSTLGFGFDAVATGFIASLEQARLVADFCRGLSEKGIPIFVDPIMGDEGRLYTGMPETMVDSMKAMLKVAHVCFPNYTEACLLAGRQYRSEGITADEAFSLVDDVHATGAASVVITSMMVDSRPSVVGYNASDDGHFIINYDQLPIQFSGTGDVFAAEMIVHLLSGDTLEAAAREAVDTVYRLIYKNRNAQDPYRGIPIEESLDVL